MHARVWIEPGCTQCHWCQDLVPEVFVCGEDGVRITAAVRQDQCTSTNRDERSPLTARAERLVDPLLLRFAADGCPAQVIRIETPTG